MDTFVITVSASFVSIDYVVYDNKLFIRMNEPSYLRTRQCTS